MAGVVKVLRLQNFQILRQLKLEEALLRASNDNWFLVNDGTPDPAIVLGISGKPEVLVHEVAARKAGVTLIRRFTGGGTVVVDSDTLFTGLIMGVDEVPGLEPFPRPIMKWTEDLFKPVFGKYGDFALREHDYVFKDVKFGGNAQAISKRRFVHHTSLLWRFDPDRMALLQHPARTPEYRQGRPHHRFITPLQDHVPSRPRLLDQLTASLGSAGFALQEASLEEAEEALARNKICGTRVL
ncbi:LPL3 [Auxenochlorella protothecoides x Auxenochlorella symbiontica]